MLAWFRLGDAKTDLRTEVIGGATTFVTMVYILFANPTILGSAGLPAAQVLTVTALVAGVMTIAMGLVANYPFAIAPGMGINAIVATSLVAAKGLTAAEAMGVIVAEGAVITVLVVVGLREAVLDAIPDTLKRAIGAGIGLFLALLGLTSGGLVARHPAVGLVLGDLTAPPTLIFAGGLLLAFVLVARRIRGGLLIAIAATTIVAIAAGQAPAPSSVVSTPDLGLVGHVSFGFIAKLGALGAVLAVFSLMLSDFFDTVGTAIGLGGEAGFLDARGRLPRMSRVLLVDSLAAVAGGFASASSATTYIESAAGIADGARTGLASVVTGLLFLATMFLAPLAGIVPPQATATALVVVGFLMCGVLRDIDWKDPTEAAPAFLTAIGMPFTASISDGIGLGAIAFVLLKLATGRASHVRPLMWLVAAAFATFFAVA